MAKTFKRTPAGIAEWPHLHAPDTKYKTEGEYTIKVRFDNPADAQEIIEEFDRLKDEAIKAEQKRRAEEKAKDPKKKFAPIKEADKSIRIDEETGAVTVGFKMTASGVSKKNGQPWSRKPALYDAAGQPLADGVRIGGGSLVKVAYDMHPFYKAIGGGVSIRLEAVQVLKLVEWGQRDASAFGFENEEPEDDTAEEATPGSDIEGAGQTESDF